MSHHHRYRSEVQEQIKQPIIESEVKPDLPIFDKSDLTFLSMIKPLLSPTAQKGLASFFESCGVEFLDNQPDLLGLLNFKTENNPLKDLLPILMNGMSGENKGTLNPLLLNTLFSMLNNNVKANNEVQG